jgi:hypothetical protein
MLRIVGLVTVALAAARVTSGGPGSADAATVNYTLRVNPGGIATLTCGWHQSFCNYGIVGDALDWDNGDNAPVYFRSYGMCSTACSGIAVAVVEYDVPFCHETRVRLRDNEGNFLGRMVYTHTSSTQAGYTFGVNGAANNWTITTVSVGTSITVETAVCGGTTHGSHVHQYHREAPWSKNPQYPNVPGTGSYDPMAVANYQVERTWSLAVASEGTETAGVLRWPPLEWRLADEHGEPGSPPPTMHHPIYGQYGDKAVSGDWDGDGRGGIGTVRQEGTAGRWRLSNSVDQPVTVKNVLFGSFTDLPVTGDWQGTGLTRIGTFRSEATNGVWRLDTDLDGDTDIYLPYGSPTDLPITGDWDCDGDETPGIFRAGEWRLNDEFDPWTNHVIWDYGISGDIPVAGDWDGDGCDSVGVYRPSNGTWYLNDDIDDENSDYVFPYGVSTDQPVVGDWDGE